MTTVDFVIELFCRNDDAMKDIHKHSQASLYPSELATLAFMFAIKGVGNRAFSTDGWNEIGSPFFLICLNGHDCFDFLKRIVI